MNDSIPKTNPTEADDSPGGNLSPSPVRKVFTDVETELRKMQRSLALANVPSAAKVCELAADIVAMSGRHKEALRVISHADDRVITDPTDVDELNRRLQQCVRIAEEALSFPNDPIQRPPLGGVRCNSWFDIF